MSMLSTPRGVVRLGAFSSVSAVGGTRRAGPFADHHIARADDQRGDAVLADGGQQLAVGDARRVRPARGHPCPHPGGQRQHHQRADADADGARGKEPVQLAVGERLAGGDAALGRGGFLGLRSGAVGEWK
jgi:hypothetical protein